MLDQIREAMRANHMPNEAEAVKRLVDMAALSAADREKISGEATRLVQQLRDEAQQGLMETFLAEYGLSTDEGIALMCLAEAMLRVPDGPTIDDLIKDKIVDEDWSKHLGAAESLLVEASTLGLVVTKTLLNDKRAPSVLRPLSLLGRRMSEPVIRTAVGQAMRIMGSQFVLGRTIEEALSNGAKPMAKGYTYSFDMLGEAARTEKDAQRYHEAYLDAIQRLVKDSVHGDVRKNPGISIKLSALHPRYEFGKRETMVDEMVARVLELVKPAAKAQMGLNIDAEEADRLDLSLEIIEKVLSDPALDGWDGFGVVVQAYGPRASYAIDWLYALAEKLDRKIMVRLVKGAYWDTEIKRAQVMGLEGYPVFTRKVNTDVSYLACARKLLDMRDRIYPQFATHNAHSASAVLHMAGNDRDGYEFQRLHGMGEGLHDSLRSQNDTGCRIYAPVGAHRDLLAYLVRRLLENGANSSFVNQVYDKKIPPSMIVSDPISEVQELDQIANDKIPMPKDLFGEKRLNAKGWDITDPLEYAELDAARSKFASPHKWVFALDEALDAKGKVQKLINPAVPDDEVGQIANATPAAVEKAIKLAGKGQKAWGKKAPSDRAMALRKAADLYEDHAAELFALASREAGKSLLDGIAEVREAVDFLRFYANEAERLGEQDDARGVIACISPWNFPLAIFTGQVAAALVAGNGVVAKPAEQSPLMGARAVELLHEAGVPKDALILVPGAGDIGAALTSQPDLGGVCFTGSTEVAKLIDKQMAKTSDSDAMVIAETGGLNAMIVDSTALPEQAIRDILASSFQSAGQRCSALRMLYVQEDVADHVLEMLYGGLEAMQVGEPWDISTDIGPVIDADAQKEISDYCAKLTSEGRLLKKIKAPKGGHFVEPHIFKVSGIEELEREIFGPVLHVATFKAKNINKVVDAVNTKGFGLTFGLHTRMDSRVEAIGKRIKVGNFYVNRNQIGAIVGSQPFGGEGLSGTGPKAGGANYLPRFRVAQHDHKVEKTGQIGAIDIATAFEEISSIEWVDRDDRAQILGADEPQMAKELPGPTGEFNRVSYSPRGRILAVGGGNDLIALSQAALLWGNRLVVVGASLPSELARLKASGAPISLIEGAVDPEKLDGLAIDGVALAGQGEGIAQLRRAIAALDGPIVSFVTSPNDVAGFVHERAVCIDTTAAGGNASLLAQTS